jgi:predicted transcriptional regulator
MNMSKTLTVRLENDVAEALEGEARRTNRSKGRIVRDALKDHLSKGRRSALDALKKYAGITEGPQDLSINKKYLAGLGKPRRP